MANDSNASQTLTDYPPAMLSFTLECAHWVLDDAKLALPEEVKAETQEDVKILPWLILRYVSYHTYFYAMK